MSTSIIIALGIVVYILVGVVVNAALKCYFAEDDGYLFGSDREAAAVCGIFWPVAGPFILFARIGIKILDGFAWVSRQLFILCFRHKHGRNPRTY